MHYYQFHIGDYLRDTAHLTLEEDATYRRLLDLYYESESPISSNFDLVARKIRSKKTLVSQLLSEYFIETPQGYAHTRVEAELKAYHDMVNGGKKGAAKRWHKGDDGQGIPTPSAGDGLGIATGMLTMNHEPITINHKETKTRSTKGSRLSLEMLPDDWRAWTTQHDISLNAGEIFETFRDYWIAQPGSKGVKLDWFATWRNWVKRQKEFVKPKSNGAGTPTITPAVKPCGKCGKPLKGGHTFTQKWGNVCSPCWSER